MTDWLDARFRFSVRDPTYLDKLSTEVEGGDVCGGGHRKSGLKDHCLEVVVACGGRGG